MVLDNPSEPPSQDTFDQSAPANDEDPFASSPSGAFQRYHIDRTILRPFPIFGPLLGYTQERWERTLDTHITRAQRLLNRPLAQEEADAYAFWSARAISQASYGAPLGIAGACYVAYNSRQRFRFPFWQPTLETFQAEVFPPKLAILRGNRAIIAWHVSRALAYSIIGGAIGNILMTSYALSSASVNLYMDKRMKGVNEAMLQQVKAERGSSQSSRRKQHGARNVPQDDASPTGSMYGDGSAGLEGNPESARTDNDRWRNETPRGGPWRKPSRPPPLEEVHETQDSGFAVFDDASPTGGQGVGADTTQHQTAGSAWERLRRGESPAQNRQTGLDQREETTQPSSQSAWSRLRNGAQQRGQDSSPTHTSESYSETDEQRESTKTKAQREFDAQVERERRGGDFSNSGGDQKRW